MRRCILLLAWALVVMAPRLSAQRCSNGTDSCLAVPVPVKKDPPIDEKRWIVLPFENITKAGDVEWLSNFSVKTLSLDLSRWTDVRVVDDARVADLLRDIAEDKRSQLGLQAALNIARRAGAGVLVMGDFLKEGSRTSFTAKVYDVRTGESIRNVREVATDSPVDALHRLPPRIMNLALPAGASLDGMGTTSMAALREYTLGVDAHTRWRQDSARIHFARAVQIDSTFALAQARMGNYAAAVRFSANLPERERILIQLQAPTLAQNVRCAYADRLMALDSADAEAWYAYGRCRQIDAPNPAERRMAWQRLTELPDGSARGTQSRQAVRLAYEHALELAPNVFALRDYLNMFLNPGISVCATDGAQPRVFTDCPDGKRYVAINAMVNDTLVNVFQPWTLEGNPALRRENAAGRRALLIHARDFAARWVAKYPQDLGAHAYYGRFSQLLGDSAVAAREFRAAAGFEKQGATTNNLGLFYAWRAEIEWKAGRPERAASLIDSISIAPGNNVAMSYEMAFGRFGQIVRRLTPLRTPGLSAESLAVLNRNGRDGYTAFLALSAGVVPPNFAEFITSGPTRTTDFRDARGLGYLLAFHTVRQRPLTDTASVFPLVRFQAFLSRGDSARAREALALYDKWGAQFLPHGYEDDWQGYELFAAEAHLELGDTATAWKRIEPYRQRFPRLDMHSATHHGGLSSPTELMGRAWLLYADLARATGHNTEARAGYRMIVGMWAKADPILQPLVTRARNALAKLGP